MECLFGRVPGDCEPCLRWTVLFESVARCKLLRGAPVGMRPDGKALCEGLNYNEQYFEPNPGTLAHWRDVHKLYIPDIDRRVMFVCESPKKQPPRSLISGHPCQPQEPDFVVPLSAEGMDMRGYRAWDRRNPNAYKFLAAKTAADDADAAKRHSDSRSPFRFFYPDDRFVGLFTDFRHAVTTNIVKCCEPDGGKPQRAVAGCSMTYLRQEIELFDPVVIVVLGPTFTDPWFEKFATETGLGNDRLVINHYSDRGNTSATLKSWTLKKKAIEARIARVPSNEVWWHDRYLRSHHSSEDA